MHYAAWILLAVYAAFAIRFAVGRTRNVASDIRESKCSDAGRWYYRPLLVLTFLMFVVLFLVWLLFWPRRRWYAWYARKERRQREREEAERKAREERVRKWKEEHPPVIYCNTVNGVTVGLPKADYDVAVEKRRRDRRNGLTTEKLLPLIRCTFLFVHASAKNVPADLSSGLLSDFDDLKKVARVERRKDIFVPFVSEVSMPFSEQEKALRRWSPWAPDALSESRLEVTRRTLLYVPVPDEVRFAPVAPPKPCGFLSRFLRPIRSRSEEHRTG